MRSFSAKNLTIGDQGSVVNIPETSSYTDSLGVTHTYDSSAISLPHFINVSFSVDTSGHHRSRLVGARLRIGLLRSAIPSLPRPCSTFPSYCVDQAFLSWRL